MKITIEHNSFNKSAKVVKTITKLYSKQPSVTIHFVFAKRPNARIIAFCLARKLHVAVTLPSKYVTNYLIHLANKNRLQLAVAGNVNKRTQRLLNKCKCVVVAKDNDGPTSPILLPQEKALYNDVLNVCYGQTAQYQCQCNSCLGKTLYVDKLGNVSFCEKYPQNSIIGNVNSPTDYFDTPLFDDVLTKEIEKREKCKATCKHFALCHGGCAMEDVCQKFVEYYQLAQQLQQDVVSQNKPLDTLDYATANTILSGATKGVLKID